MRRRSGSFCAGRRTSDVFARAQRRVKARERSCPMKPSPAFDLVDHTGRRVVPASFAPRNPLVFFGFTHCAVVCPRELAKLSRALDLLGNAAEDIQPIYVTVDPARDTEERLRASLAAYPRFLGLRGSAERIEQAKVSFRVFAQPVADRGAPDGYRVPHTAISYLLTPAGEFAQHFPASLTAEELSTKVRRYVHESR